MQTGLSCGPYSSGQFCPALSSSKYFADVVHIDKGVRHVRATRPRSWGSRTRAGSIEVDY